MNGKRIGYNKNTKNKNIWNIGHQEFFENPFVPDVCMNIQFIINILGPVSTTDPVPVSSEYSINYIIAFYQRP